jgi:hypothetical protein
MQVEVEANPSYDEQCDSIEDQDMWSLTFVVKVPAARMTHTFIVHEPYLVTLSSWQGIAAGTTKYLALYLGNGDGGISIETHDGMKMISFVGAPSGAGGDVESIFEVPLESVAAPLNAALQEAIRYKFRFAEEEPAVAP